PPFSSVWPSAARLGPGFHCLSALRSRDPFTLLPPPFSNLRSAILNSQAVACRPSASRFFQRFHLPPSSALCPPASFKPVFKIPFRLCAVTIAFRLSAPRLPQGLCMGRKAPR